MDVVGLITSVTAPRPADTGFTLQTVDDVDARHRATFPPDGTATVQAAGPADADFGSALANAIRQVEAGQAISDDLAVAAAAGDPDVDVHDVLIAQTKAKLDVQLAVTVRNAAVTAFNEIIRTPL